MKCGQFGHQKGDRECPLGGWDPFSFRGGPNSALEASNAANERRIDQFRGREKRVFVESQEEGRISQEERISNKRQRGGASDDGDDDSDNDDDESRSKKKKKKKRKREKREKKEKKKKSKSSRVEERLQKKLIKYINDNKEADKTEKIKK